MSLSSEDCFLSLFILRRYDVAASGKTVQFSQSLFGCRCSLSSVCRLLNNHCFRLVGDFRRSLVLAKGSKVVEDRDYTDNRWFASLKWKEINYAARQKHNAIYRVVERSWVNRKQGKTSDQIIQLTGAKGAQCTHRLRRVGYKDPESGYRRFRPVCKMSYAFFKSTCFGSVHWKNFWNHLQTILINRLMTDSYCCFFPNRTALT